MYMPDTALLTAPAAPAAPAASAPLAAPVPLTLTLCGYCADDISTPGGTINGYAGTFTVVAGVEDRVEHCHGCGGQALCYTYSEVSGPAVAPATHVTHVSYLAADYRGRIYLYDTGWPTFVSVFTAAGKERCLEMAGDPKTLGLADAQKFVDSLRGQAFSQMPGDVLDRGKGVYRLLADCGGDKATTQLTSVVVP